jgi:hypothetical protein
VREKSSKLVDGNAKTAAPAIKCPCKAIEKRSKRHPKAIQAQWQRSPLQIAGSPIEQRLVAVPTRQGSVYHNQKTTPKGFNRAQTAARRAYPAAIS